MSSSTVLRFSIQIASTGPSSTIHVFWLRLLAALRPRRPRSCPGGWARRSESGRQASPPRTLQPVILAAHQTPAPGPRRPRACATARRRRRLSSRPCWGPCGQTSARIRRRGRREESNPTSEGYCRRQFPCAARIKHPAVAQAAQAFVPRVRPLACGAVMALGFIRQITCLVPISVSAPARHSMIALLPAPLGPTCRSRFGFVFGGKRIQSLWELGQWGSQIRGIDPLALSTCPI